MTKVTFNIDSRDKISWERLCRELGMTTEETVQKLVCMMLVTQSLPFRVEVPSERLKKALACRKKIGFESVQDSYDYLYHDYSGNYHLNRSTKAFYSHNRIRLSHAIPIVTMGEDEDFS